MESKYEIVELLGKGKFGSVFLGKRKKTGENVAIKIESLESPIKTIRNETTILNYLNQNGCLQDIPCVYWYGKIQNKYLGLVMTYYNGISLTEYINKRMFMDDYSGFMIDAINILEKIHQLKIIHRDIKPAHFLFSGGKWYLIDFGLATVYDEKDDRFCNKNNNNNNPNNDPNLNPITICEEIPVGTPKYASINLHMGKTPAREDDLISLGYIYLELSFGILPWQRTAKHKEWEYLSSSFLDDQTPVKNFLKDLYFSNNNNKINYNQLRIYFS